VTGARSFRLARAPRAADRATPRAAPPFNVDWPLTRSIATRFRRGCGAALLLLTLPAAAGGQAADLRIDAAGTRATVSGALVGSASYPADRAVAALGGTLLRDRRGGSILLFGDTIRLFTFSSLIHLRGEVHQLAFPVTVRQGTLYVPEQFFIEWLPKRYPQEIAFADGVLRSRAGPLLAATTAGGSNGGEAGNGQQTGGRAQENAGDRSQQSTGATRAGSPAPSPTARPGSSASEQQPPATQPVPPTPRPTPNIVVIDAGHGGRDPGKIGPNRLREKDVALALAKRLRELLQSRGYEVHLTRSSDTLVALSDRPHMANVWKDGRPTAIFLSIHANSVARGDARGFETFLLSDARTEDERRVAEMENAAVEFEDVPAHVGTELDGILAGLRNDYYVRASNELAEIVQSQLALFHTGPNRGVKRAGFRVLVGALMPAVLVEVAFISNRQEANLLGTSAFQDKVAWGLAAAVDTFFQRHAHLLTAAPR
jgi:N-acetylmuramoyl-L-alanine amidase